VRGVLTSLLSDDRARRNLPWGCHPICSGIRFATIVSRINTSVRCAGGILLSHFPGLEVAFVRHGLVVWPMVYYRGTNFSRFCRVNPQGDRVRQVIILQRNTDLAHALRSRIVHNWIAAAISCAMKLAVSSRSSE